MIFGYIVINSLKFLYNWVIEICNIDDNLVKILEVY